jgi:hypothetical protein
MEDHAKEWLRRQRRVPLDHLPVPQPQEEGELLDLPGKVADADGAVVRWT